MHPNLFIVRIHTSFDITIWVFAARMMGQIFSIACDNFFECICACGCVCVLFSVTHFDLLISQLPDMVQKSFYTSD